jgi:orotidine-5'-phosphate decarboxylase
LELCRQVDEKDKNQLSRRREEDLGDGGKEKIILALDVKDMAQARHWVDLLKEYIGFFKVGHQLFASAGPAVVGMIKDLGGRVFLDLKFHDIPATVSRAGEEAVKLGVAMFTLHASGGLEMMQRTVAAVEATAKQSGIAKPIILAVTVLTSFGQDELRRVGVSKQLEEVVVLLAKLAQQAKVDGVVASAREVMLIRESCGEDFVIVTPGIRPRGAKLEDQRRVHTPREAIAQGANYLVVGRPILQSKDPVKAVNDIIREIN